MGIAATLLSAVGPAVRLQAQGPPPSEGAAEVPANSPAAHLQPVQPESRLSFPGHVRTGAAYSSPIERSNLLSVLSLEQGFAVWNARPHALVPYAAVRVSVDERGFDWNNKAMAQVGVKYVRSFANGVLQAGAGYAHESRMASDFRAGQAIAFANCWFGWGATIAGAPLKPRLFSFPGSSWAEVGNHAPAEGHNVIALAYLEQGVTAARVGGIGIIPFVELTISADSARRGWNNVRMFGEGVKLTMAVGGALLEAAAIYRQEHRWRERRSENGLAGFAHLRYSWNMSARR